MSDPRIPASRTFRWNDGSSTAGYHAVELSRADGARWYRWSHVPGEGRIEEAHQSLEDLLAHGPAGSPPPSVAARIAATARALSDSPSDR